MLGSPLTLVEARIRVLVRTGKNCFSSSSTVGSAELHDCSKNQRENRRQQTRIGSNDT